MGIDFSRKVVGLNMRKGQTTTNTTDMESHTPIFNCIYKTTTTPYFNPCPHRLPCGYCRLLMQDCPKNNNIRVTCDACW